MKIGPHLQMFNGLLKAERLQKLKPKSGEAQNKLIS